MSAAVARIVFVATDASACAYFVGPVTLTDEYLAHIARVEALPQSQSGSDKTRCVLSFTATFKLNSIDARKRSTNSLSGPHVGLTMRRIDLGCALTCGQHTPLIH